MEHSRLLKFLTEERNKTTMAESSTFKIQREYETPLNISAEVPGEQEIREGIENGGQRISYTEVHTTVQTGSQTIQRTISTVASEEITPMFEVEERVIEPKKSRIPQLKFKEAAEKVNKKKKEQNGNTLPRRSSIPKLISLKRASSFKEDMTNDEFDKIYDEIVDDKQKDIDDKILTVKIDDPVKVETKFEEIIHAYDSNDDSVKHTEILKLSKIPWRRKSSGGSKIGSLVEKVKSKNAVPSNLQDGGFKVSASSITTKRFSRGNSVEVSHNQKMNVVETTDSNNTNREFVEDTVITETIEGRPVKTKVTLRGISRGISYATTNDVIDIKEFEFPQNSEETVQVEEFDGDRLVTKETITRQTIKTGIPIKFERNPNISRDLNKRPATLDDRDLVNSEVVKHEELQDGNSRTTITETTSREIPIRTEKNTRSISRTFSRDGKSITVSPKMKEHSNEITPKENGKSFTSKIPHLDKSKTDLKQEVLITENNTKDNIKIATPVFKQVSKTENYTKDTKIAVPISKTTHSYSKGSLKNIERSKSIEWRAADEIRTKSYVRSHSEHTSKLDRRDKKIGTTVTEKQEAKDIILLKTQDPVVQAKVADEINEQVVEQTVNVIKESNAITATLNQSDVNANSVPSDYNNLAPVQKEIQDDNSLPVLSKDNTIESVPVLKGNVSKIITQISEKEIIDLPKTDIDLEENVLKKKSVLSKIAMFEGKEPEEISIKVKKCIIKNKTPTLDTEEDVEEGFGLEDNTTQPKIDSNEPTTEINNEAINMVHIWKSQEQNIENISVVHQNEHVTVLPEAINFIVTENAEINRKVEIPSSETGFNFNTEGNKAESLVILPDKLDFEHNENQVETSQLVPEKFDAERGARTPEKSVILPAKIDFIPNESNDSAVKYSPETVVTQRKKSQEAVKKPGIGKLNLDLWNKKIEVNRQFVGKGKFVKTSNTLSDKSVSKIERTKDNSEEVATILPAKIDFAANEDVLQEAVILPQAIESFVVNETILSTDKNINHAEQIILLPEKIDYVHDEKQIEAATANILVEERQLEVATTLPAKLDFNTNESLHSSIEYSPETVKITNNEKTDVKRPRVGKLNLDLWNKQVEVNKQYVGKGKHSESNQTQIKIPKIVASKTLYEKKLSEIEKVSKIAENLEVTSESQDELLKIHETVTHDISQSETIIRQNKSPAVLPENIAFTPEVVRDMPTILPGRIDFVPNEDQLLSITQTVIPEAIDVTVSEKEGTVTKFSHKMLTKQNSEVEQGALLPISLDFIHQEYQVHDAQIETEKTWNKKDESRPELTAALPAKLDFSPNESEGVTIEHSVGKISIQDTEKRPVIRRTRVGKLDLSIWNKQIEVNKQLVSKGNYTETILPLDKLPKILPEKSIYKSDAAKIEALKINVMNQGDKATTLPAKIDIATDTVFSEVIQILPETIDFTMHEGQLTVPIDRPDTPLAGKIDFSSQKSEIIIPDTNEFQNNDNIIDTPIVITAKIESSIVENTKDLSEKVDIKLVHQSSENFDNDSTEGEYEIDDNNNDREIASDPELVDSEPEIGETKLSIMSRFNNKLYATTHRHASNYIAVRTNQERSYSSISAPAEDFTTRNDAVDHNTTVTGNKQYASTENYIKINENVIQNNNFESETIYGKQYRTRMKSYSIVEKVGTKSKEEMKRSKSLAELDLGDAVKGQVQRMLYRLKSGDYERSETPKNRKISIKEMPIKCSVSEKIALFEGKSTSSTSVKLERTVETTTLSSKTVTSFPANKTQPIPEEVYLRKIEDLATAKMRYNKSEMLYLSLGNGDQMPAIALGTALLNPRLATQIVAAAIDLGYRAIDSAYIYGTERDVGQAIKTKIDDGTVTREDLFIMSKLWSTFHDPSLVEQACRASLEAMGLDYFDLYMIHNPMSFKEGGDSIPKIATVIQFSEHDYLDAWFGMEALVTKGLVKSIGLSNFNSKQIQKILDKGRIRPLVNQVECHPYLTQHNLDGFCKERNITLSCFSVLGSKGTPKEYKSNVTAAIDDPLIKVMASGLNVTAARLLVRYQIQLGRQAVVKSSSAEHLWDILQALTFELNQHEIDAISALNRNKRIFTFEGMGHLHKNYPFNIPF